MHSPLCTSVPVCPGLWCKYQRMSVLLWQEQWVWGRSEDEARQRAAVKYGVEPGAITLTQGDSSPSYPLLLYQLMKSLLFRS